MSCPSKTNACPRRSNFPLTHVRRSSFQRLGVGLAFADMHCDVRDCTLPCRQPLGDSRRSNDCRMYPSDGCVALHGSVVSSASPHRLFCRRIHRSTRAHADEGLIATRVLEEFAARATGSSARNPVLQSAEALFESARWQVRSVCTQAAQADVSCRAEPTTRQPRPGRPASTGQSA